MTDIGIRELRQNASQHVRAAAAGEDRVISDRGVPVARLVPLTPMEQALHDLVTEHALVPPPRARRRYSADTRLEAAPLTELVDEGRRERDLLGRE